MTEGGRHGRSGAQRNRQSGNKVQQKALRPHHSPKIRYRPKRAGPATCKVPELGRIVNHIRARAATEPGAAKRRAESGAEANRNSASILSEHTALKQGACSQKARIGCCRSAAARL
jgi:hypothetical protein